MARTITEQDILNATSYMPIAKKVSTAQAVAYLAISQVEVTTSDDQDKERSFKLPVRYIENVQTRALYQMMLLLTFYLKQEIGENLTVEEYDAWGESAIFNQLDRLKQSKNVEVRNKVYDILDDYRELTKFIGSEIASRLTVQNDPIERIGAWLADQVTPEMIEKVKEALTSARDELVSYNEDRKQKGLS